MNDHKRNLTNYKQTVARKRDRDRAFGILGAKCAKCGSLEGLQFDHIRRDRDGRRQMLSRMFGRRKWEDIEAELKKCQVLCMGCHAKKTVLDRGQLPKKKDNQAAEVLS